MLIATAMVCVQMMTALPALAQSDSVLMRRPLPSFGSPSDQTGITPTPPSIPVGPAPDMGNDGDLIDPADPVDPDHSVDKGWYNWVVGNWQGSGTCGAEDAVLTRSVSCMSTFSGEAGSSTQWDYVQRKVDPSLCTGVMPATTLKGEGANCSYDLVTSEWSEWSESCAPSAYRTRSVSCVRQDGQAVHIDFCRLNLQDGGSPYAQYVDAREEGAAYSGCKVKWQYQYEGSPWSNACAGDPPSFSYDYVPRCVVDESWLDWPTRAEALALPGEDNEAVCIRKGQGSSPRNDPTQQLACNFYDNQSSTICTGDRIGEEVRLPYGTGNVFDQAYATCAQVRSGCMMVRQDARDADPSDQTPASGRYYTISCHQGYGTQPFSGSPVSHAGTAHFTAYGDNPPAYQTKDVPPEELMTQ